MKIGIIVALGKELGLLLGMIEDRSVVTINGFDFHVGRIGQREVVAMQCGIGKVNAAIGTLSMIENFHPSLVINSGVAGGTGQGAKMGDLVVASQIGYHDVWCGPDTNWGQAAGCPSLFECPVDPYALADKLGGKAGLVASGDIFVSRREDVERILDLYPNAIGVDMESGAVAQTCFLKNVPMLCMRIVSDTPGQADNEAQYSNFWEDAPQHTFQAIKTLIASC
ncbi:MAG: 5'-methylthioadenosine/adenosylhomocysteine nucleosidase [Bacteroidales bacterium]|nr:5'-methylthioadenosine/adenosylhomocysteine nucleosidase [Bacteroidales bacterium]